MARTTSKTKTRTKPAKRRFKLTVEGQLMLVDYTPNWLAGAFGTGHFEFHSPYKPARRIPVSRSGFLSHFAAMEEIEAETSPQEFALLYALSCIRKASPEKIEAAERSQPTFFGLLDGR